MKKTIKIYFRTLERLGYIHNKRGKECELHKYYPNEETVSLVQSHIYDEIRRHFAPNTPVERRLTENWLELTGEAKEEENLDYLEWI